MLFWNIIRKSAFACITAVVLSGAGCAAQRADTPVAAGFVNGAQVFAPGTALSLGEGTYYMPALPPSASETNFALTGQGSQPWQSEGRWINGINGSVYVPPTQ